MPVNKARDFSLYHTPNPHRDTKDQKNNKIKPHSTDTYNSV